MIGVPFTLGAASAAIRAVWRAELVDIGTFASPSACWTTAITATVAARRIILAATGTGAALIRDVGIGKTSRYQRIARISAKKLGTRRHAFLSGPQGQRSQAVYHAIYALRFIVGNGKQCLLQSLQA